MFLQTREANNWAYRNHSHVGFTIFSLLQEKMKRNLFLSQVNLKTVLTRSCKGGERSMLLHLQLHRFNQRSDIPPEETYEDT